MHSGRQYTSHGFDPLTTRRSIPGGRLIGVSVTVPSSFDVLTTQRIQEHLHNAVPKDQRKKLETFVQAASRVLEYLYDLAIMGQTIEARFLGPAEYIEFPRLPLQDGDINDVTGVSKANSGTSTNHSVNNYFLKGSGQVVRMYHKHDALIVSGDDELIVTYKAGFPSSSEAETQKDEQNAIPKNITESIMKLVDDLYHDRGSYLVAKGIRIQDLPTSVQLLMMEYRRMHV